MDEFLRVFTEGDFDESYIEDIYSINQDNVPEVGSLNSLDQQQKLLSVSSYHSILLKDHELIGFAICFRGSLDAIPSRVWASRESAMENPPKLRVLKRVGERRRAKNMNFR